MDLIIHIAGSGSLLFFFFFLFSSGFSLFVALTLESGVWGGVGGGVYVLADLPGVGN